MRIIRIYTAVAVLAMCAVARRLKQFEWGDFTFDANSVSFDSEFLDFASAWDVSFGDFNNPGFGASGSYSWSVEDANGDLVYSNAASGATAFDFDGGESAFAYAASSGTRNEEDGGISLDSINGFYTDGGATDSIDIAAESVTFLSGFDGIQNIQNNVASRVQAGDIVASANARQTSAFASADVVPGELPSTAALSTSDSDRVDSTLQVINNAGFNTALQLTAALVYDDTANELDDDRFQSSSVLDMNSAVEVNSNTLSYRNADGGFVEMASGLRSLNPDNVLGRTTPTSIENQARISRLSGSSSIESSVDNVVNELTERIRLTSTSASVELPTGDGGAFVSQTGSRVGADGISQPYFMETQNLATLSTVGSATSGIAQSVGFDIGSESASVSSFLDVFGSVSVDTETQTETLTQQFVGNTGPTIVASGLPGQGGSYAVTGFLRELGDANSEADLTASSRLLVTTNGPGLNVLLGDLTTSSLQPDVSSVPRTSVLPFEIAQQGGIFVQVDRSDTDFDVTP